MEVSERSLKVCLSSRRKNVVAWKRITATLHRFVTKTRNRVNSDNLFFTFFFLLVPQLKPKDCLNYKAETNRLSVRLIKYKELSKCFFSPLITVVVLRSSSFSRGYA